MSEHDSEINRILEAIRQLKSEQDVTSSELIFLTKQLTNLKQRQTHQSQKTTQLLQDVARLNQSKESNAIQSLDKQVPTNAIEPIQEHPHQDTSVNKAIARKVKSQQKTKIKRPPLFEMPTINVDLEKFIGENLINKIGIAIFIIGVAIGAKYSIDQGYLSPLYRIILGYVAGLALLGIGIWLKPKYLNYSAVLVSGAMAILYIITYMGYSFYQLFPQTIAFGFMSLCTVFTVVAALQYNRQIIALIGLVGAYAVPFLLSNDTGQFTILLSYVALINVGILFVALKKYWKLLYYSAFTFSWLIYYSAYTFREFKQLIPINLVFLFVFFITFYLIFIAFKLNQRRSFEKIDIGLLFINSFIFFGLGYMIIANMQNGDQYLGLFTLVNALIHFGVSVVIYRSKLADRGIFFMVAGLVLIFLTMSIPIQLDGSWVTLIWAGEAALLFWLGRTKAIPFYEKASYALMILAAMSLWIDWQSGYTYQYWNKAKLQLTPILNIYFLTSVLTILAMAWINYIHYKEEYPRPSHLDKGIYSLMKFIIPFLLFTGLYGMFAMEINAFWNQLYQTSEVPIGMNDAQRHQTVHNSDYLYFRQLSIFFYSIIFFTLLSWVNLKYVKDYKLAYISLGFNVFWLFTFLGQGLLAISNLRDNYLDQVNADYFSHSIINLGIRYIAYCLVAMLLYISYLVIRSLNNNKLLRKLFIIITAITILWLLSSELLHWMDIGGKSNSYKLGLSILWGIYALVVIALGIWKNNKYLRIGGIILFALTLIKLFFYDISGLDTISRTIAMISLGILLLLVSFLYNKFNTSITHDEND